MKKEKITVEKLAVMIQKGFKETATKTDIKEVTKRLDKIENTLLEKHEENIRYLKERGRKLENALAIE
jgi:hypothetical protein